MTVRPLRMIGLVFCLAAMVAVANQSAAALEIGPDDLRISYTGIDGDPATDATNPDLAFDPIHNRFLTVWAADAVDGVTRIHARLLYGNSGQPAGPEFVVDPGAPDSTVSRHPCVVFNDDTQEWLVAWSTDAASPGAFEIVARRLSHDGVPVGSAVRLSDMGSVDTDTAYDAVTPDVIYLKATGVYVVVWAGDDDTGLLTDGRFEIYGQLLAAVAGIEVGPNDFRISTMGPDELGNDALAPAIAERTGTGDYAVVWEGDILDDGAHNPEIYMQRFTGITAVGPALMASLTGASAADDQAARNPDVAHHPVTDELLLVWDAEDFFGSSVRGQRVTSTGVEVGIDDFDIAGYYVMMPPSYRAAVDPAVVYDPTTEGWFTAWRGDIDDSTPALDFEVFAQLIDANGLLQYMNDVQLSSMGQGPALGANAGEPRLAINTVIGSVEATWSGDEAVLPRVAGEHEVHVQGWSESLTGVEDDFVGAFALYGAAPNPFNPTTVIAFNLARSGSTTLKVYDAAGRVVRTLVQGDRLDAGQHQQTWDGRDDHGRDVPSGVYMYRLISDGEHGLGRVVLLK